MNDEQKEQFKELAGASYNDIVDSLEVSFKVVADIIKMPPTVQEAMIPVDGDVDLSRRIGALAATILLMGKMIVEALHQEEDKEDKEDNNNNLETFHA